MHLTLGEMTPFPQGFGRFDSVIQPVPPNLRDYRTEIEELRYVEPSVFESASRDMDSDITTFPERVGIYGEKSGGKSLDALFLCGTFVDQTRSESTGSIDLRSKTNVSTCD